MEIDWSAYPCDGLYDELVVGAGRGRQPVPDLLADLRDLGAQELAARQEAANLAIKEMGISFTVYWVSVLKSLTAYQMYRRSEQIRVQRSAVLRFLFQSSEFPRSVLHCVDAVRTSLEDLPRNEAALRVAGRLKRNVAEVKLARLTQAELHAFVDELQGDIANLHGEIAASWFPPPSAAV